MTDEQKESKSEATRVFEKLGEDFTKHVIKGDLSSILLKGHLLVENYLDHTMLLLFDKEANISNKGFNAKLIELKEKKCFRDHKTTVASLFALNKVRNELAHRLDFEVTISHIDSIGYILGKEYILKKYEKDIDNKTLLLWVLNEIIFNVYYPIWDAIVTKNGRDTK